MNILVFYGKRQEPQDLLKTRYESSFDPDTEQNPKRYIRHNKRTDEYSFKVQARFPHVYNRKGTKSVITYKVNKRQKRFIDSMPNTILVLATCDDNPDSDYQWIGTAQGQQTKKDKFLSVVGLDFFTGSGVQGDDDYVAPRKKLAVLL